MKKIFLLVCGGLMLTSCDTINYFQVCEVGSNLPQSSQGKYEYKDNSCTVSYDFWCSGGNPGFEFTNNSDEIIYLDLSKSFFIKNGNAYDYFLNRTVSASASYVESASASKSGTAYGYWNAIGGLIPGSVTASLNVGKSAAKSSTVETEEKSIVAIPPHSSKIFTEYSIISEYFYDCDYNITPGKKDRPTYNFQLSNSPIRFSNFITYTIGNDPTSHSFTNDFFVNSVSYYHEKAILEKEKVGCPKEERKIEVFNCASPNRFYMKYHKLPTRE